MNHTHFMQMALELALGGSGYVNPNPLVGAVIVKDGKIIGKGFHAHYGDLHAERVALANCSESPAGATIYVTLEPCCHHGKTPPCTDAILESGISRVVVGATDPNPKVAGDGIKILRDAGIEVIEGVLEDECKVQNAVFFHYIQRQTPYVVMKYAMTADGKIATTTGDSKWISGEVSRQHVHHTRHALSGIMVGIGTVMADDPLLTARIPDAKQPARIICDSRLSIPVDSKILQTAKEIPTIIAYAKKDARKTETLEKLGVELVYLPNEHGQVDLPALMQYLHTKKVDSVLLEGGSSLNFSMLKAGLVQKLQIYIAPKLFGGQNAKTPIGGAGIPLVNDAIKLSKPTVTPMGEDVLLEYEVLGGVPLCLPE